ncbi:hypothetical protein P872_20005 [Rhodonellum psychrophilum GCM71 = DSM 17998]|uniref:Uncharacterized protein n=1 Tax=Rhodonellum psychrophilum GCM71 = DSM 17998 TaxID=1123057 RepID=U5BYB4_9BACT|nr:hypothetical protein P872_20005 [Rhodonellum psychrophilum GCM71 = DSM 17998]
MKIHSGNVKCGRFPVKDCSRVWPVTSGFYLSYAFPIGFDPEING